MLSETKEKDESASPIVEQRKGPFLVAPGIVREACISIT
jgi:hypothetical protein